MYLLSFILSFHLSFPSISIVKGTRQTITFASPHRLENLRWNSTGSERQITLSLRPRSVIFSRSQGRSRRSGPRRVETPKMLWILSMCIQRRLILSLSVCGYTLKSVTFAYGYTQVCLQIFWCFFVLFIHFRYFAYMLVQNRSITRYHTKLFSLLWLNLYNARLLH